MFWGIPDISDSQSNPFPFSCVWPGGVHALPMVETCLDWDGDDVDDGDDDDRGLY